MASVTLADNLRTRRVREDEIPVIDFGPFLSGGDAEKKAVAIKKNVSRDDREIEGVYAGLIRSIQNGSEVLDEGSNFIGIHAHCQGTGVGDSPGSEVSVTCHSQGLLEC